MIKVHFLGIFHFHFFVCFSLSLELIRRFFRSLSSGNVYCCDGTARMYLRYRSLWWISFVFCIAPQAVSAHGGGRGGGV
jgi:hypothetical protein